VDASFPASKRLPINNEISLHSNLQQKFAIYVRRSFLQGRPMRRRVIAGNWKMFKTLAETRAFFSAFNPLVAGSTHCDIVVAPPFTAISTAVEATKGTKIAIGGQNLSWSKEGAFTGEVSAAMLAEAGCRYVIVGHSERRQLFRETDDNVAKKTLMALSVGLTPIVCVGETDEERSNGLEQQILKRQFTGGPGALTAEEFSRILLAYEPIWAIGTGKVATPEIAAAAHRFIRACAAEQFSTAHAEDLRVLYGGSVKPDNIKGLMAQEGLDGALVGGASLDPKSFASIVNF
jgi:triosephosphate isomerase